MEKLVIIGLGGAGYTAGIYSSRYGLNPVVIGESDGGMITENPIVENFSGYAEPTSGYQIMENMKKQAESFGTRLLNDRAISILPVDENDFSKGYKIQTNFNGEILAQSLVLAVGTEKIKLGVPGEKELFGKGVSYCATCDGFFFKGKTVAVVGGGDTALIESLYLSDICEKVYLIHRRTAFRGEPIWFERVSKKKNIEIITPATIKQITGEQKVTGMSLSISSGELFDQNNIISERNVEVNGVFVAVGTKPNHVEGLDQWLKRDEGGYIVVDNHQSTNLPGVFSAGDCSTGSGKFRQLIVACGEGAVAAESAFKYLSISQVQQAVTQ